MLSNDNISAGLVDKLYSSYVVLALQPETSILSSGVKLNNGSCLGILKTDPSVEKFGLIVDVYSDSVKWPSLIIFLLILSMKFSST